MHTLKAKLVGIAPIVFHNERLANPANPITRELKRLMLAKPRTDAILLEIKWIEWRAGFYENEGRPAIPSDNVLACTLQAARKFKRGKDVSSGVFAKDAFFPLSYDGPKTIEAMKGNEQFCDYRGVVIGGKRVMRARPIFRDWSCLVEFQFDEDIINRRDLEQALEIAGERIGLCERRPRWGRFLSEVLEN